MWASGCWHYEQTLYSQKPSNGVPGHGHREIVNIQNSNNRVIIHILWLVAMETLMVIDCLVDKPSLDSLSLKLCLSASRIVD